METPPSASDILTMVIKFVWSKQWKAVLDQTLRSVHCYQMDTLSSSVKHAKAGWGVGGVKCIATSDNYLKLPLPHSPILLPTYVFPVLE